MDFVHSHGVPYLAVLVVKTQFMSHCQYVFYSFVSLSVVKLIWANIMHPPCLCHQSNSCQAWLEKRSRFSLCPLSPSLSLMCQSSRARVGQAAMSISSIHQAVDRVAEKG